MFPSFESVFPQAVTIVNVAEGAIVIAAAFWLASMLVGVIRQFLGIHRQRERED